MEDTVWLRLIAYVGYANKRTQGRPNPKAIDPLNTNTAFGKEPVTRYTSET